MISNMLKTGQELAKDYHYQQFKEPLPICPECGNGHKICFKADYLTHRIDYHKTWYVEVLADFYMILRGERCCGWDSCCNAPKPAYPQICDCETKIGRSSDTVKYIINRLDSDMEDVTYNIKRLKSRLEDW